MSERAGGSDRGSRWLAFTACDRGRTRALLLSTVLVTACGGAPSDPTESAPSPGPTGSVPGVPAAPMTPPPAPGSERLLAEAPPGWRQAFRTDRPATRLVEYVPPGTAVEDWTEKVAFESFSGDPLPQPGPMLDGLAREQALGCERFEAHATFDGTENGYPTAVRLMVCPRNPVTDTGQITFVKAIRGREHFYVVTRALRVPPITPGTEAAVPPETMAEWSLYLRAIAVCEAGSAEHPCPDAAAAASAAAGPDASAEDVEAGEDG